MRSKFLVVGMLSLFILIVAVLLGCSSGGSLGNDTINYSVTSAGDSITSLTLENKDGKLIGTTSPILAPSTGLPYGEADAAKIKLQASAGTSLAKVLPLNSKSSTTVPSLNALSSCSADLTFGKGVASSADIAFLVDTTSSMGSAVEGIINSIETFADTLSASGLDVRFALATFGDAYSTKLASGSSYTIGTGQWEPPSFDADERPLQDFSSLVDFKAFATEVKSVVGGGAGGGDSPENYYGAVMAMAGLRTGQTGLTPRAGVPYYQILVGDDCSHTKESPGDSSGIWIPDPKADLSKLSGKVTVHVVRDPDRDTCGTDELSLVQIADATGGAKLDLGDGTVDLSALKLADFITNFWLINFGSGCVLTDPTFYLKLILTVDDNGDGTPERTQTFTITMNVTSA